MSAAASFSELLQAAVADVAANGYDSPEQIEAWLLKLRLATEREIGTADQVEAAMRAALDAIFVRLIDKGQIGKYVPDVPRYTIAMIRPQLRGELDRRIMASADLVKLNRTEAIHKTLQRFSGWATSIPQGGVSDESKRDVKTLVGKALKDYRYHQRFVAQDQGHKLIANVADIVAHDNGAIAGIWHSHVGQPGYNARKEHAERNKKYYAIKDCWAIREGLMTRGAGYLGDMTAAGQEPHCRCYIQYIMSLRRLPPEMLTAKGKAWVEKGKAA